MKITILSTHPPAGNGNLEQNRLENLIKFLSAAGHEVQACGILNSSDYGKIEGYVDVPCKEKIERYVNNFNSFGDLAIGEIASKDEHYFRKLFDKIILRPDVIVVEGPWLFGFAVKFANILGDTRPRIIYDSHNIEYKLKKSISKNCNFNFEEVRHVSERIEAAELFAIKNASAINAVSQHDASWLKSLADVPVVIAPNGVSDRSCTFSDVSEANIITSRKKFALHALGNHMQHVDDFFEIFSGGVGSLSPEQLLVGIGEAANLISSDVRFKKVPGLSTRYVAAGSASDAQLKGLLTTAALFVLPITTGPDLNISTAEALWTGCSVVTTSIAMRGYENYIGCSGIHVHDNPREFVMKIGELLNSERFIMSAQERSERTRLLWSETLKPILNLIVDGGARNE